MFWSEVVSISGIDIDKILLLNIIFDCNCVCEISLEILNYKIIIV